MKTIKKQQLTSGMDPHRVVARYAVYIKENATMVEHLPFVRDGRSAKVILYFLRAEA